MPPISIGISSEPHWNLIGISSEDERMIKQLSPSKKSRPCFVIAYRLANITSLYTLHKNPTKSQLFLHIFPKSCTFAIVNQLNILYHLSYMPQMIMLGSEMIRINPAKNTIEYSTSQGRSWSTRYSSTSCGEFIDLLPYGNELIAATSKGIYYSTSQGRSWSSRYMSSTCGEFECLMDGGRELLAQTSKGLYYSTSSGRSWSKRR